jgi:phosphatidylserine/phosphatidylglycerophosphate/cardiolipin synthase-like enzyme
MRNLFGLFAASLLCAACAADATPEPEGPSPDAEHAGVAAPGKADSTLTECQVDAALLFANDPSADVSALRAAGVHSAAAKRIVAARAGVEGVAFASLSELDAVPYVGPFALGKLAAKGASECPAGDYPSAEVIMSPQPSRDTSHLARAVELIDAAKASIDIAMYSFSDGQILEALGRARGRGVAVRFLYEPARDEAKSPAGTRSAQIEAKGIDVRFINKIMHHKLMIVDGPRSSAFSALGATLMTGSGNWSSSAATRYDENTVVLRGVPELALGFQREFNHLWESSRDFVSTTPQAPEASLPISSWMSLDSPSTDAAFTSDNFGLFSSSLGPGFSVLPEKNTVADVLVGLIGEAEKSIWIASGHLRSRPVTEALLAKAAAHPELDVRVYVDGQEYVSAYTSAEEKKKLEGCVAQAGTSTSKQQACYDKDFHWSYPVAQAGVPLRFKHYAYRWHYTYAPQMHHKYFVIDEKVVASGSYNLSDNAEHATMENMVVYRGGTFAGLVGEFVENFQTIWQTGEAAGSYAKVLDEVKNGTGPVPLVYDSMALSHAEVTELKQAIRDACPVVDSEEYRKSPEKHFTCPRQ